MARIHPTAIIEENVTLGEGTSIWDNVHIRHGATLGEECIVGEKTYIAYDVQVGNRVKINAMVYRPRQRSRTIASQGRRCPI